MAEDEWNSYKKPQFIPNIERMPIPHKIRTHQRQRVGRSTTTYRVSKTLERQSKHQKDCRKTSRAQSDLWLDFNVDEPILDSDDEEHTAVEEALETSEAVYTNSCKKFGVTPRKRVLEHLSECQLSITGGILLLRDIQPLAYSLTMNNTIAVLDVSDNNLCSDGLKQLTRMLEENVTITELDVSYNNLGYEGAVLIGYLLSINGTLTRLNAAGNGFGDKEARCLSNGLIQNASIIKLNLSNNNFQDHGGSMFAEVLEQNNQLEEIDLSWNQIRNIGAVAIGNSLQKNDSLKYLNVSWNGFSDIGCETVGKSLITNTFLTTLDLSSNRITYDGCRHLARALRINEILFTLKINFNSITTRGVLELFMAIKENVNSAICCLELAEIPVTQTCVNLIQDICQANPNFKVQHDVTVLSDDTILRFYKPK